MALGLFVSAFATSEFQAVQFMPAFVLPQLLLVRPVRAARRRWPDALETLSAALPFTYAYDALAGRPRRVDARLAVDVVVVAGAIVAALVLGATTLRRRTP